MNLLSQFKNYLFSQKNPPSKLTVKNYAADVNQFIRWFETELGKEFNPQEISPETIEAYKKAKSVSTRSLERHLSSLRKFFQFLRTEGIISSDPLQQQSNVKQQPSDNWHLKEFKDYLYVYGASDLTIKNYIIDIQGFQRWCEEVVISKDEYIVSNKNPLQKLNQFVVEEYKNRMLNILHLSPKSVNRKLSSIRKYFEFARKQGYIHEVQSSKFKVQSVIEEKKISLEEFKVNNQQSTINNQSRNYSRIPPIRLVQKSFKPYVLLEEKLADLVTKLQRKTKQNKTQNNVVSRSLMISNVSKEFYAPHQISIKNFPFHRKAWHHIRYTRPNWYKKYHSYPIVHYFHFAILVIFAAGVGIALYQNLVAKPKTPTFATGPVAPPRILSFQGRLTDNNDNPITSPTAIRFGIYNDLTATDSAGSTIFPWQEVQTVTPDQDGIFSVYLGANTTIPQSLFAQNAALYLGVTIGTTDELRPRQQLATVAYATNAEVLQGMPPITQAAAGTTNVILALDGSGNLTIGGTATPTFSATGGQFTLSGQVLQLTTSNGTNIQLAPDGLGMIDAQKPIVNTTLNGNVLPGNVEVQDRFSVLATDSGNAAFIVNQNTTGGDILAASSSGTTKFRITNDGSASTSGDFVVAKGKQIKSAYGALNLAYKSGADAWSNALTVMDNSGAVGIGTTSPTYAADIYANSVTGGYPLRAIANNSASGSQLEFNGYNLNAFLNISAYSATGGQSAGINLASKTSTGKQVSLFVDESDSQKFKINVAGTFSRTAFAATNALTIQQDGNVGIGTTTPTGSILQVAGNITPEADGTRDLGASGLKWNNLYVNNIIGASTGISGYWQRNAGAIFPTNITDDLIVGTTSTPSASSTNYFQVYGSGTNAGSATMSGNLTIGEGGQIRSQYGPLNLAYKSGADAWTTGITLEESGNVGVGNTISLNPSHTQIRLGAPTASVNGLMMSSNEFFIFSDSIDPAVVGASNVVNNFNNYIGVLLRRTSTGTGNFIQGQDYLGNIQFNIDNNGGIWSYSSGDNYFAGNVGIGTTGPGAALDVNGNVNISGYATASGSLAVGYSSTPVGPGNAVFSGNVGIGTTSPATKLYSLTGGNNQFYLEGKSSSTSVGNGQVGIFLLNTNSTTNNREGIFFRGSSGSVGAGIEGVNTDQTNNYSALAFETRNSGGWGQRMWLDSSGNVGIGTTTPTGSILQVAGNITPEADGTRDLGASGLHWDTIYANNIVGSGALGYWQNDSNVLHPANSLASIADLVIGGTGTSSADFQVFGSGTNAGSATMSGNLTIGYGDQIRSQYGALNLAYKSGADTWTTGLTLLDNSGNVGIGTTAPGYKLEVNGNGYFSNTTTSGDGLRSYATLAGTATGTVAGVRAQLSTSGGSAASNGMYITGLFAVGEHDGSNTVADIRGITALARTNSTNVGAILTNAYSGYFEGPQNNQVGPSITNAYSVYVTSPTVGTSKNFAVYQNGAAYNYFGGNVGIGTTTPAAKLDVNGDVNISGYATASGSLAVGYSSVPVGPGNAVFSGNVGIGTTTPASLLDVLSGSTDIRFRVSATETTGDPYSLGMQSARKIMLSSEQGSYRQAFALSDVNTTTDTAFGFATSVDGGSTWNPDLTILQNGNVGIGVTAPLSKLQIGNYNSGSGEPTNHGDLVLQNNASTLEAQSGIEFKHYYNASTSPNGTGWKIQSVNDANDDFMFASRVNSSTWSQKVTIQAGGNMGIGVTSPASILQVAGNITPEADGTRDLGASGLKWNNLYVNNVIATGAVGYWQNDSNVLHPANELASIAKLVIGGTSTASAEFSADALGNATASSSLFSSVYKDLDNTAYYMDLANPSYSILTAGNIGIGTTTPGNKLEVNGTANVYGDGQGFMVEDLAAGSSPNYTANFRYDSSALGLSNIARIRLGGGTGPNGFGISNFDTTMLMYIQKGGNVGIGTTAPGALLDVNGNVNISGYATASGSLAIGYSSTPVGPGNAVFSGNVGIGTTSPSETLNIYKDFAGQQGIRIENPHTTSNGGVRLDLSRGANYRPAYVRYQSGTTDEWYVGELYNAGSANTDFSIATGYNLSDSKFVIQSSDGNVGIGTTSPSQLLDVEGNGYFLGNVGIGVGPSTVATLYVSRSQGDIGARTGYGSYVQAIGTTTTQSNTAIIGSYSLTRLDGAGWINNNVYGIDGVAQLNSNATVVGLYGGIFAANIANTKTGIATNAASLYATGADAEDGSMINAYAIFATTPTVDTGAITTAFGLRLYPGAALGTGSVGNLYPLFIDADSRTTTTNKYGLYIGTMSGATNNYQLYIAGTADSYFAGQVGIGITNPAASLDLGASGTFNCAGCVHQGEVSTTTATEYSTSNISCANSTTFTDKYISLCGNTNYCFFPVTKEAQCTTTLGNAEITIKSHQNTSDLTNTYDTNLDLMVRNNGTGGTHTLYAKSLSIQASPPYYIDGYYMKHFIYFMKDKTSGAVVSGYQGEDPPWENFSNNPDNRPHPFNGYTKNGQDAMSSAEIDLIDPSDIEKWKQEAAQKGTTLLPYLEAYYEIDPTPVTLPISPKTGKPIRLPKGTVWKRLRLRSTPNLYAMPETPRPSTEGKLVENNYLSDQAPFGDGSPLMGPGDIVDIHAKSQEDQNNILEKSTTDNSRNLAGVVREDINDLTDLILKNGHTRSDQISLLADQGKATDVRISTINGPIKEGDPITSSQIPGIGAKSTQAGYIVGKAIESFDGSNATWFMHKKDGNWIPDQTACQTGEECYPVAKIKILANSSWYDPQVYLADTGDIKIIDQNATVSGVLAIDSPNLNGQFSTSSANFAIVDASGNIIKRVGVFSEAVIGSLRAGLIDTQRLTTNSLAVATDKITVGGLSLRDYIAQISSEIFNSQFSIFNSKGTLTTASVNGVRTNLISPLASDSAAISMKIDNNKMSIINNQFGTGSAVASIDNQGNASFAGTLNSQQITTNNASISGQLQANSGQFGDATISGTLRAGNIIADNIEGLEAKIATITAQQILASSNQRSASSSDQTAISQTDQQTASPSAGAIPDVTALSPQLPTNFIDIASFSASFGTFRDGLVALAPSTFSQLTAVDSISIGTNLTISTSAINALGQDLELQPLRQGGISFLAGAVRINTDGNLIVNGSAEFAKDVKVKGVLSANIISPLPDSDLIIKLGNDESGIKNHNSSLKIHNSNNSTVLSVDQEGNIISSGSAYFDKNIIASGSAFLSKLNLLSQPAYALSDSEFVATGSAGTAVLKAYKKEVTINNPLVTDKSLIYITPITDTLSQSLYLLRQIPGISFTVGIGAPVSGDIQFNFLIVN